MDHISNEVFFALLALFALVWVIRWAWQSVRATRHEGPSVRRLNYRSRGARH